MEELSLFPNLLMAYLDPGSGSLIIQLIISAVIGIGFFFRSKLGKFFKRFKKDSDASEDDQIEDDLIDV